MSAVLAPMPAVASPWADLTATLDPAHLRAMLQRGLPGFQSGTLLIEAVRVSKVHRSSSVRRNPHPVTMGLELDVRHGATGDVSTQRLYAKAFRDGASAAAFAAADRTALVQPAFGSALSHLGELDMLVWAWPNDPSMPQLAALLNPAQQIAYGPEALRSSAGTTISVEVLRYEPERRATLRCTQSAPGRDAAARVVYGKTFSDATTAQALQQRFEYFWQRAQSDRTAAWVAQPLGWDRSTRTFWQAAAPGEPLMALASRSDAQTELARIATSLAKLHLAALPAEANRSTVHWLAELRRRVQKISRAIPGLAARAQALADTLEALTLRLARARQTLIHGDFHPEQVWLDGERVVFFDFDEFALGNPMEDLAEFIVKLEQRSGPTERCTRQIEAFTAAYRSAAPHSFNDLWLLWHRALQTLLQASRAFIFQELGWRARVESHLAASESLANGLRLQAAASS